MLYDGDTFQHGGRAFRVRIEYDHDAGPPWEECDGHGPVSDWTRRSKLPGERVLHEDRGSFRYYDYQEAIKMAKRDGWDAPPYKTGTKGQRAARAVEADFKFLSDWCNDRWQYVGVIVEHEDSGETDSLWRVETNDMAYVETVARELADELNHRLDCAMATAIEASRPDMYAA